MLDLFEYEAVMEPEAPAGEAAAAEPVVEEPAAAEEPSAALAGGFDESFRTDPAFRDAVAEEADAIVQARLAEMLPRYMTPNVQPQDNGGFDWTQIDQYGDDFGPQLGQGIQSVVDAAISRAIGPVTQSLEQAQQAAALETGEQYAKDMISDSLARGGDVTDEGKNAIRGLAEAFMPEAVTRYGSSPRAAEMAIETAVNVVRQIEQAAAQKALDQHTNSIATLAAAPAEPGQAGAASAIPGTPAEYRSREAVASGLIRKFSSAA